MPWLNQDQKEAIDESPKWMIVSIVAGACAILLVIVLAFMWVAGVGFFSKATAETRGQTGVREQTVADPRYRIANYDKFFEQCQAIVSLEGQIGLTKQSIQTDDQTQLFYDQQNLRALQGRRLELVSVYNANAAKAGTAGQFRDASLPQKIEPNGDSTSCD